MEEERDPDQNNGVCIYKIEELILRLFDLDFLADDIQDAPNETLRR